MANDRADAIGKATQDLAAMHDKESLHTLMADLQHLKGADDKIDKGDQQGIFKQDVAQIAKSVDLKALGLDGFHVASYAESDNHQYLLALKPGANQGDKPDVKIVDQDGVFYKLNGDHLAVDSSQKQAFAATDTQAPAPVPAPVKVADSGDTRGDAAPLAPAAPAADGADNSFGTHGRTFDVGADGKAVYTTKHGDTYWSVARDLLTKSDKPAPSNAEILAQVNALATLNNKSDANKLATGEHIILPITPATPEAAPAAPAAPAKPEVQQAPAPAKPEVQQAPAPAKPEAVKPPVEVAKPPVTELQKPTTPAPAVPAAPLGFDMKAHADALKPQNGVYSPLSPLGMNGLGLDADKATLAGDAKAPVTKDNVTTQETDLNLKDGVIFGYWRTGVKNVDTTQGNILKSRETSYDSGVQMKMAGPKGAVELNGVTHVMTTMQDNGMYKTVVTAGDGQHTFSTDSTGKVQRSTDANNQASVLEAPTATDLAALNVQPLPTAVADASVAPAVVSKPAVPKAVDSAVDVP